jgi:hypothetical protein
VYRTVDMIDRAAGEHRVGWQPAIRNKQSSPHQMRLLAYGESLLAGSLFCRPTRVCARCQRLLFLGIDAGPRLLISRVKRSIASMANIKASAADDGSGPVTSSCSFRLAVFESLPFVLKILARHFPGSYLNALMSNPLYCMARPGVCLHSGTHPSARRL